MTFADLVDIYWQMLEGQCLGLPKVYSWRTKACDFPLSCHSSSVPVRLHVVERALIFRPINPPAQTHFVVTILPAMWQMQVIRRFQRMNSQEWHLGGPALLHGCCLFVGIHSSIIVLLSWYTKHKMVLWLTASLLARRRPYFVVGLYSSLGEGQGRVLNNVSVKLFPFTSTKTVFANKGIRSMWSWAAAVEVNCLLLKYPQGMRSSRAIPWSIADVPMALRSHKGISSSYPFYSKVVIVACTHPFPSTKSRG